jgi:hypothetical protein
MFRIRTSKLNEIKELANKNGVEVIGNISGFNELIFQFPGGYSMIILADYSFTKQRVSSLSLALYDRYAAGTTTTLTHITYNILRYSYVGPDGKTEYNIWGSQIVLFLKHIVLNFDKIRNREIILNYDPETNGSKFPLTISKIFRSFHASL